MQELEKLKDVLLDLNRNQLKFSAQLSELEALQTQVAVLEQRAETDPEAARKVRSVHEYMAHEGQHTQRQIVAHVGAFERHLVSVREQLSALTVTESEPPHTAPARMQRAHKHNRNFA